jgi:hypothetical protein
MGESKECLFANMKPEANPTKLILRKTKIFSVFDVKLECLWHTKILSVLKNGQA